MHAHHKEKAHIRVCADILARYCPHDLTSNTYLFIYLFAFCKFAYISVKGQAIKMQQINHRQSVIFYYYKSITLHRENNENSCKKAQLKTHLQTTQLRHKIPRYTCTQTALYSEHKDGVLNIWRTSTNLENKQKKSNRNEAIRKMSLLTDH